MSDLQDPISRDLELGERVRPTVPVAILARITLVLLLAWMGDSLIGPIVLRHSTDLTFRQLRSKWEILRSLERPVDWLILGDSSCNQGIDPNRFQAAGLTAVNLATTGSLSVSNDAWMMNDHLERLGPPKNVLLVLSFSTFDFPFDPHALISVPAGGWNWRRLNPRVEPPPLSLKIVLSRYLFTYNQGHYLSSFLLQKAPGQDKTFTASGFMSSRTGNAVRVVNEKDHVLGLIPRQGPSISPRNEEALRHLFDLADRHHFQLFVAMGPLARSYMEDQRLVNYLTTLDQKISELAGQRTHVRYLRQKFLYNDDAFDSPHHLVHAAAIDYTDKILAILPRDSTSFSPTLPGRISPLYCELCRNL